MQIAALILDVMVLAPMAWGAYIGFRKGLLSEVVSILHYSIAFIICFKVVGLVLSLLREHAFKFGVEAYPRLVFVLGALLAIVLLDKIGDHFKTEIDYDFPGSWDNIIGAVIGLLKYAIIMTFMIWTLEGTGSFKSKMEKKSILYSVVKKIGEELAGKKNKHNISTMIKNSI
jgi:membrane protein required for colicin V production